jgi:hypothetical protein
MGGKSWRGLDIGRGEGDAPTRLSGLMGSFHSAPSSTRRGSAGEKQRGPVDKGWCMRLHEAGLPSLIVSLGNDYKLTWNVCCNESDGHRLAALSEHMLLCKQAR